jgi:hypothetical protein
MLMLKPLPVNQSATDASISIITFIVPTGFTTHLCIAVDLISEAVSVKRDALSNDSELKEKGRSVWLVATLGPFSPGVKRVPH